MVTWRAPRGNCQFGEFVLPIALEHSSSDPRLELALRMFFEWLMSQSLATAGICQGTGYGVVACWAGHAQLTARHWIADKSDSTGSRLTLAALLSRCDCFCVSLDEF
jgi:hypothetical protein